MDIAVVGSGGWGTALSMLLHENRHEVTLISYSKEESNNLAKTLENPFLAGVKLPEDMYLLVASGTPRISGGPLPVFTPFSLHLSMCPDFPFHEGINHTGLEHTFMISF